MKSEERKEQNHRAVVEHYAGIAEAYDRRWDRYTERTLDTLIEHLDLDRVEELLDVACGTGRLEIKLRERKPALRLTGTDLSPDMIRIAQKRLPAESTVRWVVTPAESLPFEQESFDAVVCANAFHLVPDQPAALQEFHRVLRPNGQLIIVDWCPEYLTVALLLAGSRGFGRQYRQLHRTRDLAALVERHHFSIEAALPFRATWFWGLHVVKGRRHGGTEGCHGQRP